ncbi:MAG: lacF 25 [Clostridia bacterium]|nr:lacF 25 [Clostridia bacterium]
MKKIKEFFQHDNIGYLFVMPALIYMLVFNGYPIIRNIILSFQDVTVKTINLAHKQFIGFENYITLFKDPVLSKSIINTLLFTICCLIVQFLIGFALALLFNNKFSVAKPIRGILMIPWMIPITITALIFRFMFASNVGIVNEALQLLGVIDKPIDWLLQPGTAMFALVAANVWIGIPFNMILLTTGLTTISEELYESASIDGASRYQKFSYITLPLLRPAIENVLILGFIYTFKVFDLVYVMTNGGPVNATQVLSTYSYKLSFELFEYSQGATVANILFVILFIVSLLYLKFTYQEEEA